MDKTTLHRQISYVKSAFRMLGCVLAFGPNGLYWFAGAMFVAEAFGIGEEVWGS